ncbi:NAD(P)-dependent oxidoreductase [Mucilaginibacter jinjuensis]|uniref:SDR family oxidoreductase n=1 Tax=Mucilaginibacter jinjuensis TaxID=1176721 RepID=A0ABY7TA20_9SPHI|nr:NAD(P)-binding oxidoreductase [Mucilaginibacter jinjuensis]WCT13355.1 SDR family oxidoreductase [Mucilaginibacter jinjuensis]
MAKRVLILGATGRTGQHAIAMALAKNYQVVALVRNPGKLGAKEGLTIIEGSPTNISDVRKAIKGCDAVLSLLSPLNRSEAISLRKIDRPQVLKSSIRNVLQVMPNFGVKRIIVLSTVGAGDSWQYAPWYVKLLVRLTNFKVIFNDHNAQEELIRLSGTNWTIVRPVGLNENRAAGDVVVSYNRTPKPFQMSRQVLAKFVIEELYSDTYVHKAPMLAEK